MAPTKRPDAVELKPQSFARIRIGEREAIKAALKNADTTHVLFSLIGSYLNGVEVSLTGLEPSVLLGRDLAAFWPASSRSELLNYLREIISPDSFQAFKLGFEPKSENTPSRPPGAEACTRVIRDIQKHGVRNQISPVRAFFNTHLRYTEATGYSYSLVRASSRIARALILCDPVEGGAFAQSILRDSIKWEPWNPILWDLWAESYLAQREHEAGELIYWEANRRFPENVQTVASLVKELASTELRIYEARLLADRFYKRFRDNHQFRNLYAFVLAETNDLDRSLDILVENWAIRAGSQHDVSLMARVVSDIYQQNPEAGMKRAVSKLPKDTDLFIGIARFLRRMHTPLLLFQSYIKESLAQFENNSLARAGLEMILTRIMTNDAPEASEFNSTHDGSNQILGELNGNERKYSEMGTSESEDRTRLVSSQKPNNDNTHSPFTATPMPPPADVLRYGKARRISFKLSSDNDNIHDEAFNELREFLSSDPTFAYAQLLAAREGLWEETNINLKAFPAAFERALNLSDISLLAKMASAHQKTRLLSEIAMAAFGDMDAAAMIRHKIKENYVELSDFERHAVSEIRLVIGENAFDFSLADHKRLVVSTLRNVNEWALAGGPWRRAA